jgi:hypothetical protein
MTDPAQAGPAPTPPGPKVEVLYLEEMTKAELVDLAAGLTPPLTLTLKPTAAELELAIRNHLESHPFSYTVEPDVPLPPPGMEVLRELSKDPAVSMSWTVATSDPKTRVVTLQPAEQPQPEAQPAGAPGILGRAASAVKGALGIEGAEKDSLPPHGADQPAAATEPGAGPAAASPAPPVQLLIVQIPGIREKSLADVRRLMGGTFNGKDGFTMHEGDGVFQVWGQRSQEQIAYDLAIKILREGFGFPKPSSFVRKLG